MGQKLPFLRHLWRAVPTDMRDELAMLRLARLARRCRRYM